MITLNWKNHYKSFIILNENEFLIHLINIYFLSVMIHPSEQIYNKFIPK